MQSIHNKRLLHVVYLGETGFPVGFGAIQRLILVSKSLIAAHSKITVIVRKGTANPDKPVNFDTEGTYEGIHYVYTSGTVYKPKSFLKRNWLKLRGIFREFQMIRSLSRKKELDVAIISCYHFGQVALYLLYAYLFKFPLVYNYVEMAKAIEHRRGLIKKVNDYLFERLLLKSMDAALPISQVLVENFRKISPGKPVFKLPILCDFEKFDVPNPDTLMPSFLYCGALDYLEVISFVLNAYDLLPSDTPHGLVLVLGGGNKADKRSLMSRIEAMQHSTKVKVFLDVPHSDIPGFYKQAIALLIPLRPTLQDEARFPHKIGEYVASGNPMISTNYGEVKYYFTDEKTALIADDYDIKQYSAKMKFVVDNPEKARVIGAEGKKLGLVEFNYLSYGERLKNFLKKSN